MDMKIDSVFYWMSIVLVKSFEQNAQQIVSIQLLFDELVDSVDVANIFQHDSSTDFNNG